MKPWTALILVLAAACDGGNKPPPPPPSPVKTMPEIPRTAPAAGTSQKDAMIDADWDAKPPAGMGNIRLMVKTAGQPFKGEGAGPTRFNFQAKARRTTMTGFNPSSKGRWVMTELDPAEYEVNVTDTQGEFKPWKKPSVKVDAGQVVTLDVDLEK